MGNGVLVDKFMGCFTPTLAELVEERLIHKYGHYRDPTCNRHKDNKYDLSEVFAVVTALVDGTTVRRPVGDTATKEVVSVAVKNEETEERMAHLQDSMVAIGKQVGSIQSAMQALQNGQMDMRNAFLNTKPHHGGSLERPTQVMMPTPGGSTYCFYCWGTGHRIAECEQVKSDVQKGWVILVDGRTRMPNRAPLPKEPSSISPHDRVMKLHDTQVGLYFGWAEEASETPTYSAYVNAVRDSRDDMLEHIQHEKVDRIGELEQGLKKLTEVMSVLVNTRPTPSSGANQQGGRDF